MLERTFALSLTVILLTSLSASAALTYEYDAAADTPGDGTWENEATPAYNIDWTFADEATPTAGTVSSSFLGLSKAYSFSATGLAGATAESFDSSDLQGTAATLEFWVKPAAIDSGDDGETPYDQVIYETGASSGLVLSYRDGVFTYTQSGRDPVSAPALSAADIDDFVQVVVTMDGSNGSADAKVWIYVNPLGDAAPGTPDGQADSDWNGFNFGSGGNGAGLAVVNSRVNGDGAPNSAPFEGDIALVRFYDAPMTDAEVGALYAGILVPEPTTLALLGLGAVAMIRRRK